MKEDFLHYIWQYQLFDTSDLKSTSGEKILIFQPGYHNLNSGPDFLEAKLQIGTQLWAGNVEIHVNSSDWYVHNHEQNPVYDTIILHVVWEEDIPVFRENNTPVSTLVLKGLVPKYIYDNYKQLFQNHNKWIACEDSLRYIDSFTINHWSERLYIERLHKKSEQIDTLLKQTVNDWEAVLFALLLRNFGLKVNGEAFQELAGRLDFSVVRKVLFEKKNLEALLLGQAGLLSENIEDEYYKELQGIYRYQQRKHQLHPAVTCRFFRLRPPNFPTVRLAQFAGLIAENQHLFQNLMKEDTVSGLRRLMQAQAGKYWDSHFVFGKESKKSIKRTTQSFIDLLLINTVIPLKFTYQKSLGEYNPENIFSIIRSIKPEQNSIVKHFSGLSIRATNAMETQALLTLKNDYCNKQACLQCEIGMKLLNRNNNT